LIVYDQPKQGTVRVELQGFVRGICNAEVENCTFNAFSDVTPRTYVLKDGTLDLYLCHPDLAANDLDNDSDHRNTRLDKIQVDDDFVLYVSANKPEVHLIRNDEDATRPPSVPAFVIPVQPIPGKIPAGQTLTTQLKNSRDFTCPVENGVMRCPDVELTTGEVELATLSVFTVSNGDESPTSSACSDFGNISGDGSLDEDEITLIAWGRIESTLLGGTTFVDALIVAVLPLKIKVE
jgi:hypothetical protein